MMYINSFGDSDSKIAVPVSNPITTQKGRRKFILGPGIHY